ncbi:hypothetical protein [Caballeronia sp. J97]|uniref:hypothetical protein n=1 Tax=Caballeronia sp. J97 TaxID=2805429 RepID=UPI002AB017E8|nr:hypothetical protein [Caballeronia sp. J97]
MDEQVGEHRLRRDIAERADIIDELRNAFLAQQNRHARGRWKKRIDGVYVSYMLAEGQLSASTCALQINSTTSLIVKVQSPLARRSQRSGADRCGKISDRRFLSVLTVLSRRCVRRRNAVSARAFIAVHCVGAASLLP